jgi:molybdopterin converting factor small subunit
MLNEKFEIEVDKGMRLDKLLVRLDEMGKPKKGFFRAVQKGQQGVTLLLNGNRLDVYEARKTVIREGDELAILSPVSGG